MQYATINWHCHSQFFIDVWHIFTFKDDLFSRNVAVVRDILQSLSGDN